MDRVQEPSADTDTDTDTDTGAGAPEVEIELTPEMIQAGVNEFCSYDPRVEGPADVVVEIFRAMLKLSPGREV
jgi:hypothetical protein